MQTGKQIGRLHALALGERRPGCKGPELELVFMVKSGELVRRIFVLTEETAPHVRKALHALGWDGVASIGTLTPRMLSRDAEIDIKDREYVNQSTGKKSKGYEVAFINPISRLTSAPLDDVGVSEADAILRSGSVPSGVSDDGEVYDGPNPN